MTDHDEDMDTTVTADIDDGVVDSNLKPDSDGREESLQEDRVGLQSEKASSEISNNLTRTDERTNSFVTKVPDEFGMTDNQEEQIKDNLKHVGIENEPVRKEDCDDDELLKGGHLHSSIQATLEDTPVNRPDDDHGAHFDNRAAGDSDENMKTDEQGNENRRYPDVKVPGEEAVGDPIQYIKTDGSDTNTEKDEQEKEHRNDPVVTVPEGTLGNPIQYIESNTNTTDEVSPLDIAAENENVNKDELKVSDKHTNSKTTDAEANHNGTEIHILATGTNPGYSSVTQDEVTGDTPFGATNEFMPADEELIDTIKVSTTADEELVDTVKVSTRADEEVVDTNKMATHTDEKLIDTIKASENNKESPSSETASPSVSPNIISSGNMHLTNDAKVLSKETDNTVREAINNDDFHPSVQSLSLDTAANNPKDSIISNRSEHRHITEETVNAETESGEDVRPFNGIAGIDTEQLVAMANTSSTLSAGNPKEETAGTYTKQLVSISGEDARPSNETATINTEQLVSISSEDARPSNGTAGIDTEQLVPMTNTSPVLSGGDTKEELFKGSLGMTPPLINIAKGEHGSSARIRSPADQPVPGDGMHKRDTDKDQEMQPINKEETQDGEQDSDGNKSSNNNSEKDELFTDKRGAMDSNASRILDRMSPDCRNDVNLFSQMNNSENAEIDGLEFNTNGHSRNDAVIVTGQISDVGNELSSPSDKPTRYDDPSNGRSSDHENNQRGERVDIDNNLGIPQDRSYTKYESESQMGVIKANEEHLTKPVMEEEAGVNRSNQQPSFLTELLNHLPEEKENSRDSTMSAVTEESQGPTNNAEVRNHSYPNHVHDNVDERVETMEGSNEVLLDNEIDDKSFQIQQSNISVSQSSTENLEEASNIDTTRHHNIAETGEYSSRLPEDTFKSKSHTLLGERNEMLEIREDKMTTQNKQPSDIGEAIENNMFPRTRKATGGDNISEHGSDTEEHVSSVNAMVTETETVHDLSEAMSTKHTDLNDEEKESAMYSSKVTHMENTPNNMGTYFTGKLPALDENDSSALHTKDSISFHQNMVNKGSNNDHIHRNEDVVNGDNDRKQSLAMESEDTQTEHQKLIFTVLKQYERDDWDMNELHPSKKKSERKRSIPKDSHPSHKVPPKITKGGSLQEFVLKANAPAFIHRHEHEIPISPSRSTSSEFKRRRKSTPIESRPLSSSISEKSKSETQTRLRKDNLEIEKAKLTVGNIDELTSNIISQSYNADPISKTIFDDLPQMKKISQYTEEEHLNSAHNTPRDNFKEIEEVERSNKIPDREIPAISREAHTNIIRETELFENNETLVGLATRQSNVQHNEANQTPTKETSSPNTWHTIPEREIAVISREAEHARETEFEDNETLVRLATKQSKAQHNEGNQTPAKKTSSPTTCQTYDTKTPNIPNEYFGQSTETDIKAMIETAKAAFHQEREVSQLGSLPVIPKKLKSGSEKSSSTVSRRKDVAFTASLPYLTDISSVMTDDSLICSKCLEIDADIASAGFCSVCQQYLCGRCINLHKESKLTHKHEILKSYCVNELKALRYVKATGYCADCEHFLCSKCVIMHTGFRKFRHHHIIQSSFVSKPKTKRESSTDHSTNETYELDESLQNTQYNGDAKEKKHLLNELDKPSPLNRFPFVNIPASLYPGPKKKLGPSYTSSPYWPRASVQVPSLPYLIPPKSYKEPIPGLPYMQNHEAGIYQVSKSVISARVAKLKAIESRYGLNPAKVTARRHEEGFHTATSKKSPELFSLPNISVNSSVMNNRGTRPHSTDEHSNPLPKRNVLKTAKYVGDKSVTIPFPSNEDKTEILAMVVLFNGRLIVADKKNNNIKVFNSHFECKSVLQFRNRLVDICTSNICPTDIYAATVKHIYEITTSKGIELKRKLKGEIKRIEGLACWKNGVAVVYVKSKLTWEILLLDYRGNVNSKLEVLNPSSNEIQRDVLCHVTATKGGKCITITDTKNSYVIGIDVITRSIMYEIKLECPGKLRFLTSDGNQNVYVSCEDRVFQVTKKGTVLGQAIEEGNGQNFGCIVYNKVNDRLYVQTAQDVVSVYQLFNRSW